LLLKSNNKYAIRKTDILMYISKIETNININNINLTNYDQTNLPQDHILIYDLY